MIKNEHTHTHTKTNKLVQITKGKLKLSGVGGLPKRGENTDLGDLRTVLMAATTQRLGKFVLRLVSSLALSWVWLVWIHWVWLVWIQTIHIPPGPGREMVRGSLLTAHPKLSAVKPHSACL